MGSTSDDAQWAKLLSFIGYGSIDAPWWFIGFEEGTKDQTVQNSLRAHRAYRGDVVDLGEAMTLMRFTEMPTNPTWRFIAQVAAALNGSGDWHHYLAHRMGRADGETLLSEVLPLPVPRISKWPDDYKARWATRRIYENEVLPSRVRMLAQMIALNQPRLVVGYGKKNWSIYGKVTPGVAWADEHIEQTILRHGTTGGTRLALVVGPTSRQMNGPTKPAIVARLVQLASS